MYRKPLKSFYAPAERAEKCELEKQSRIFFDNDILTQFANSISQMILVLNQERQIVFTNDQFLEFLQVENYSKIIGLRPGESVDCIYANDVEGGCGTSEFCRTCGSVSAILESISGITSIQECRILTKNNTALNLKVRATPFIIDGQKFSIFTIIDIGNEKRKKNLERVFFHDMLNSIGGILGLSTILQEIENPKEIKSIAKILHTAAENMIDEIHSQRQLSEAEQGELEINIYDFDSLDFLYELHQNYSKHHLYSNKILSIDAKSVKMLVTTDKILLRRIISNMLNNALEATTSNSTITLTCKKQNDKVRFAVHNPGYIEKEIQLQIFQRSYSTKGEGRGIGTYSMKLLGERYLKGKVSFESTIENGTTFFIDV